MSAAERSPSEINFAWVTRLRWAAIAGQAATIAGVQKGLGVELPLAALAVVLAIESLLNLACFLWLRRGRAVTDTVVFATLCVDVVVLTALLYLTGGPNNPFSFLYLVQIALAANVLAERWTWVLVALSLVASGVLFVWHEPLELPHGEHDHGGGEFNLHLQGMWVAFGVAAAFIVYFVMRTTRELTAQRAGREAAERVAMQKQRLASLATLAAGAAHELATPLGTIALAARELERALAAAGQSEALDDARLILDQLGRCRAILDHMSSDAGASAGEGPSELRLDALAGRVVEDLAERPPVRLEVTDGERSLCLPARSIAVALRGLVKNAQDASPADAEVTVRVRGTLGGLRVEVADRGTGMAPEILAHAGEPFFTTKDPGRGMGLGLFLAREVVEGVGGRLELDSAPGRGTTVVVELPATIRRTPGAA